MNKILLIKSIVLTVFVAFAVALTVFAFRPQFAGTRQGKTDENYIRSENCLTCHENHFASWRKTHHGRMTQEAKAETVQGDFEHNNTLEYMGVKTRMEKRGPQFYMSFAYPDGKSESYRIEKTIGSRRMEQYTARLDDGQNYRLPVAYDLTQGRWVSLNGSFFYPDGGDFKQHLAQWDTNCVFCHNVKAQPNYNFQTRLAKTEVAELGIACGACHGQGAEHAEAASSPLTRALWHSDEKADTKIVDPLKIDTDRSMMICGHCHGQRTPEPQTRIRDIMSKGDPFDAGENLAEFYKPIHSDTKIGDVSFANRFWPDGSPRLTAYEYQGILGSACFTRGNPGNRINCLSCHTMHEGDIKGQITEEKRTNTACTQCHTQLAETTALTAHTRHGAESAGSSCYSCHMPEVVSGIMAFHKTHDITIPKPALTAEKGVPNACNQCHIDRSVNWAITQAKLLWPDHYKDSIISPDRQFETEEGVRGLFAGDALTRAMMADALAKHSSPEWSTPFLAEAFAGDNYPIVRYFSANGLDTSQTGLPKPDYLADAGTRDAQISRWLETVDPARRRELAKIIEFLRKQRKDVDLEIGE
jgi:predicted CXXCH cytochrome family protein